MIMADQQVSTPTAVTLLSINALTPSPFSVKSV